MRGIYGGDLLLFGGGLLDRDIGNIINTTSSKIFNKTSSSLHLTIDLANQTIIKKLWLIWVWQPNVAWQFVMNLFLYVGTYFPKFSYWLSFYTLSKHR